MKKIIVIVIVFPLAAWGAFRIYKIRSTVPAESIEAIQRQEGIPVRVFAVETRLLKDSVSISGEIQPFLEAKIAPVLSDRIETIHVAAGQPVKQGDLLVTLEAAKSKLRVEEAQAALAQARARLLQLENGLRPEEIEIARSKVVEAESAVTLAEQELTRQQGLFKEEAGTQQQLQQAENHHRNAKALLDTARANYELARKGPRQEEIDQARAQVRLAEAALGQAQENLSDHYLRAPYDGVVSLRLLEAGNIVDVRQPILYLVEVSRVYLTVDVSELYISRMQPGMEVAFTVDALGTGRFTGTVADINPIPNPGTREYRTRILTENSDGRLRAGMFGRAEVVVREIPDARVVPVDAIRTEGAAQYVLCVDEQSQARRVDVTLGREYGEWVHVLSGLSPGERVICLSQETVQAGTKVSAVQENVNRQ